MDSGFKGKDTLRNTPGNVLDDVLVGGLVFEIGILFDEDDVSEDVVKNVVSLSIFN